MKKRKGMSPLGAGVALVAIAVVGGAFAGVGPFSATSGGDAPTEVKDATLNLAASQLGSSSKIGTTAYATLNDGTVVSKSLSSGQFTAWSNTFTNKMSGVTVRAFDSSNYPIATQISFDGQTTLNKEIKTAAIATASDVSVELRETSGSNDNDNTVDVAAGGQATIDSVRASVDIQDVYWNPGRIYVDLPSNTNVTVNMPNAEEVAVPDSAPSGVDKAYKAYNPAKGSNTFEEFATYDSSQLTISGDDSNDPSESVTVYVDDIQAYQDSETGSIEYGVEDGSDTNLGLAEQSVTLTVN